MRTRRKKGNAISIADGVATIGMKNGHITTIDATDVPLAERHTWHASYNPSISGYYACAKLEGTTIYLHRVVMGSPKGLTVDHINHDTLDNRRSNLKVCSQSVNSNNRKTADPRSKTGVRGVSFWWDTDGRPYYIAKVASVRWFPFTEQGKADAEKEHERLLKIREPYLKTRPRSNGITVVNSPYGPRYKAHASVTLVFPQTAQGLEAAAIAVAKLREEIGQQEVGRAR